MFFFIKILVLKGKATKINFKTEHHSEHHTTSQTQTLKRRKNG